MSTLRSDGDASPAHLSRRPDLPRLTVLRGLGALVVIVGHVVLLHPLASDTWNMRLNDLIEPLGIAGVSGFFTLSGFVLTWTMPPGTAARSFWRRRVARLFPVHAVTWAIALAALAVLGTSGAWWKMLPSLLLFNVWIPDLEILWGPNTPSWTLSVEAFFYLLFPLLVAVAWRIRERHLYTALIAIAALTWVWAALVAAIVPATHIISDGTPFSRTQYFAIVVFAPARLLDFALGIVLARIVIAGRVPGGLRPAVYLSVIAGYIGARWVIPQPFGFVCAMVPAVIIGVLYSARADLAGIPSRWPTARLQWVGELSFSLYMVHWPVVYGGYHLLGSPIWTPIEALVAGAAMLAVSIGLAQVLHTRIEVPLYRALRGPRPASAGPPQPAAVLLPITGGPDAAGERAASGPGDAARARS